MVSSRYPNLRIRAELDKYKPKSSNTPANNEPIWKPFPNKPQEEAYNSLADELFYGGAAGGG
jgi:hypothetical protein